jgi:peptidyl-prolyl cis-trans isomerase C
MKSIAIFALSVSSLVFAQPPSALTPETVVARIGEQAVTAGEVMTVLQNRPPQAQKKLDGKALIEELGFVRKLAAMAEKAHLDQQDPWKKTLELQRTYTMASAELQAAMDAIPVSGEEQKKFYENNKDQYAQAKVKLLYVSFQNNPTMQSDPKAKKILNESQAKAKIDKLLAQIRSGADFVKLLKENSDDSASVAKDGDFGDSIRRSEKSIPDNIMSAIFGLKPGQVSDPVRTTSGYYLFRMEELTLQPYEEVRDNIFIQIRQRHWEEWREKIQKSVDVKIENEDFFNKISASAPTAK